MCTTKNVLSCVSYFLYIAGDLSWRVANRLDSYYLCNVYQFLMEKSHKVQEYNNNFGPWAKVKQD